MKNFKVGDYVKLEKYNKEGYLIAKRTGRFSGWVLGVVKGDGWTDFFSTRTYFCQYKISKKYNIKKFYYVNEGSIKHDTLRDRYQKLRKLYK